MKKDLGESKTIHAGEFAQVHLERLPGRETWRIKSADVNWTEGAPSIPYTGYELKTRTYSAEANGWDKREFDSPEAASAFIRERIPELRSPPHSQDTTNFLRR
jgi:hypothetical protein